MVLPAPIVPLSETALIDAAALDRGQTLADLMARAGAALADEAELMAPEGPILIATGPGNNGGDGWVAAELLAERGRQVAVWPVREPRTDLAQRAAERARRSVEVIARPDVECPALIVDCILGAGTKGPLRAWAHDAVVALSALGAPVLAADAPTGIGTDTLLQPQRVLCFQLPKAELLDDERVGEFKTVDIGIDPAATTDMQRACLQRFPMHHASGHKGQHGELLVIAGGSFPGALSFACRAAFICGCDLVRAWTSDGPSLPASIIVHRQPGRWLAPAVPELLSPLIARASAVLIGPGLGREPGTREAAVQAFSLAMDMDVPLVVDADGITHLTPALRSVGLDGPELLITPHRGEGRTLLGCAVEEEDIHRFAHSKRVVLLKGQHDFLSDGRHWQRNRRGNPRMAMGGTGDCLSGLAAGLLARGCTPFDAARIASYWLNTAADELWLEQGPCYDPDAILARLPQVLKHELEAIDRWPPLAE
ncbi:MAG: NAD(P)H-hydrate dehydratase [Planctomycetota bacterium]|jgi:hydroxyethylthiazole kinase-like uncharacterized protein yjeF|nr:NAD(P)H-hydrate dehydratase [Planctomycetota bacterium]